MQNSGKYWVAYLLWPWDAQRQLNIYYVFQWLVSNVLVSIVFVFLSQTFPSTDKNVSALISINKWSRLPHEGVTSARRCRRCYIRYISRPCSVNFIAKTVYFEITDKYVYIFIIFTWRQLARFVTGPYRDRSGADGAALRLRITRDHYCDTTTLTYWFHLQLEPRCAGGPYLSIGELPNKLQ